MSDYPVIEYIIYKDHLGCWPVGWVPDILYDGSDGIRRTHIVEDVLVYIQATNPFGPNATDTYSVLLMEKGVYLAVRDWFWPNLRNRCTSTGVWYEIHTTTLGDLWEQFVSSCALDMCPPIMLADHIVLKVTIEVKDGVVVASNVETLQ
jgi:hypothetical protein